MTTSNQPEIFCIAPWIHTYQDPQGKRQLCCMSTPQIGKSSESLDEFWNGEYLKLIREKFLNGEIPKECKSCQDCIDPQKRYSSNFNKDLDEDMLKDIIEKTSTDGHTSLMPTSYDYRLSNECNFMCRMCGDKFSSRWEKYNKSHNIKIESPAQTQREQERSYAELYTALREERLKTIYWVGGEPLITSFHWKFMNDVIKSGQANKMFCKYTTNLSVIRREEQHLIFDILNNFRGYDIEASVDAAGIVGEYIRTGFFWDQFKDNLKEIHSVSRPEKNRRISMELTLTLPGLFGLKELVEFSNEERIIINCHLVYGNKDLNALSPLALPKDILDPIIKELLKYIFPVLSVYNQNLFNLLSSLTTMDTFNQIKIRPHCSRLVDLEKNQNDKFLLSNIYSQNEHVLRWWEEFSCETSFDSP